MTLHAERVAPEEQVLAVPALEVFKAGHLATIGALKFEGSRPRSVRLGSEAELRALDMLRTTPPPTRESNWSDSRVCNDVNPEIFFAEPKDDDTIYAKYAFCRGCPVRGDCLLVALRNPDSVGIWGGFDNDDRRSEEYRQLGAAMLVDYPR